MMDARAAKRPSGQAMTHRRAVLAMIAVTLMWSIAGVVTRHLEAARSFEVTFWRSSFNALALVVMLMLWRGPRLLWGSLRDGGRALWISGVCWSVMFTAFMVGITLTTVANVLVTMALSPLLTALLARILLGHRLAMRTWCAIVCAGAGIGWMYGHELRTASGAQLLGIALAASVPVASAINWITLQQSQRTGVAQDMLPAVLIGALISAAATLPFALPLAASAHDLGWLALLGSVQLALPCLLTVLVARVLPAPEIALLALLEVVFGVAWAWLGAAEAPSSSVLAGGLVVLATLAVHELLALRRVAAAPP